ncbi:MAG: hypothetical protein IRZ18_04780 [Clostridia bacterium]|nr:hypothetical protein [Clostridia bacterium]
MPVDRPANGDEAVAALNKLLAEALRALGDAGETDRACRLAASGWALLRETWPREAERLNGVLHYLTQRPITVARRPRGTDGAAGRPEPR